MDKMCIGCGRLESEGDIEPPAFACCPDSDYKVIPEGFEYWISNFKSLGNKLEESEKNRDGLRDALWKTKSQLAEEKAKNEKIVELEKWFRPLQMIALENPEKNTDQFANQVLSYVDKLDEIFSTQPPQQEEGKKETPFVCPMCIHNQLKHLCNECKESKRDV